MGVLHFRTKIFFGKKDLPTIFQQSKISDGQLPLLPCHGATPLISTDHEPCSKTLSCQGLSVRQNSQKFYLSESSRLRIYLRKSRTTMFCQNSKQNYLTLKSVQMEVKGSVIKPI